MIKLRTDVAIVGCGPVGMVLASLLGRRDVKVIVIDRALDVFPLPRAAHLDHTVLRVMQELDCLDEVLPGMSPNSALVLADGDLKPLVTMPAAGVGKSGYPASSYFYQPDFDRALEAVTAATPGVEIFRGLEMDSYVQDSTTVTLQCTRLADAESVEVEAEWIVGCDGSWSPTREAWGLPLESLDFDERWLVLDLTLPEDAPPMPTHALQVCDPNRPWATNPVPGGRYRVEMRLRDDDDVERLKHPEQIRTFLRPLVGDARFGVQRDGVYTFHGLVAPRWRVGRALIAGDAAHQMPPFLGQGMVSGIRDAHNLAWKLAGVVDGSYAERILDTYQEERDSHVRSIIRAAIAIGRFVSVSDADQVRARNDALRAGKLTGVPTFRLPDLESGTLVMDSGGGYFPQPVGAAGSPTLDGRLGTGFSIVSTVQLSAAEARWWRQNLGAVTLCVDDLGEDAGAVRAWLEKEGTPVVVVRPDRYIFAAADTLEEITHELRGSYRMNSVGLLSSRRTTASQASSVGGRLP